MRLLACAVMLLALGACQTVQPWERGTLARDEMQWQDDIMESTLRKQTHASKEASSGGGGAAGGGCGCN